MFAFHVPAHLILLQKVGSHKGALDPAIHHASQIPKPQVSFKYKADNDDAPWYPSLTHKYNALVPLGHVYTDADDDTTVMYVCFDSFPLSTLMHLTELIIHTATRLTI